MKLASLLSGGKDSVYAVQVARSRAWEVIHTVTLAPHNPESWMFHYPNPEIAQAQSKLMNKPNRTIETQGEKEKELQDLKKGLKKLKEEKSIEGFVSGAIESEYQKKRLEYIGEDLDLKSFTPLWRKDPYKMMKEQIESGYRYIFTQVSSGGLDRSWLGREVDKKTLDELKELKEDIGIHIAGEGGEYEVAVLEAPIFQGRIEITEAEKKMESTNRGVYNIKDFTVTQE